MTYQELKDKLDELTEEQLSMEMLVYDTIEDEFVNGLIFYDKLPSDNSLIEHPYFVY